MSDRSPASLTIYAFPPENERAILNLIQEHGLAHEYIDDVHDENEVHLGVPYVDFEANVSIAFALGNALVPLGVTFELYTDPFAEWDGACYLHVPDVGVYTGLCDAAGNIHVDVETIDSIISRTSQSHSALIAALNLQTGAAVRNGLANYRKIRTQ